MLARVATRPLAQAVRRLRLPTVDLYGWLARANWPCLRADNAQVARLAADHLLERGFRHLAYCGFTGVNYSEARLPPVRRCLREPGHACHVYTSPRAGQLAGITASEQRGLLYEADLADWLRALPRPVGILACNDVRGQQILST